MCFVPHCKMYQISQDKANAPFPANRYPKDTKRIVKSNGRVSYFQIFNVFLYFLPFDRMVRTLCTDRSLRINRVKDILLYRNSASYKQEPQYSVPVFAGTEKS